MFVRWIGEAHTKEGETSPDLSHPYKCPRCAKTFQRLDHLARHNRSHIKPYVCQFQGCTKRFARSAELNRHYRLVHLVHGRSGEPQSTANRHGGRPKKDWTPPRERLFVRFVTTASPNLTLLEQIVFEDGFKVSLKHLQNKVRHMFGPRSPDDPRYDSQLRPKDFDEMNNRVEEFMNCMKKWQDLRRRKGTSQEPSIPTTNANSQSTSLEAGLTRIGVNIVSFQQESDLQMVDPDFDIMPIFKSRTDTSASDYTSPYNSPFCNSSSSSFQHSFGSSSSSIALENLSIGSSRSPGSNLCACSQTSLQNTASEFRPKRNKISAIKRYLRYTRHSHSPTAASSTPSLVAARKAIKDCGCGSREEKNLYNICFALSCFLTSGLEELSLELAFIHAHFQDQSNRDTRCCEFCLHASCLDYQCLCISMSGTLVRERLDFTNLPLHSCALTGPDLATLERLITEAEDAGQLNAYGETFMHILDPSKLLLEPKNLLRLLSYLDSKGFPFEAIDYKGRNFLLRLITHDHWARCPAFNDPYQPGAEAFIIIRATDIVSHEQRPWSLMRSRDVHGGSLVTQLVRLAIKAVPEGVKKLYSQFINAYCGQDLIRDANGNSILHRAVALGRQTAVMNMLDLGADPWEVNSEGMDPAVFGWGFLELYKDDREKYANVWVCMSRVLEKQHGIKLFGGRTTNHILMHSMYSPFWGGPSGYHTGIQNPSQRSRCDSTNLSLNNRLTASSKITNTHRTRKAKPCPQSGHGSATRQAQLVRDHVPNFCHHNHQQTGVNGLRKVAMDPNNSTRPPSPLEGIVPLPSPQQDSRGRKLLDLVRLGLRRH